MLQFNDDNKVFLNSSEVLSFIDNENKITIFLEKGFEKDSDTEDVFRGLVSDETFEESEVFIDALEFEGEVSHTLFLSNAIEETPFNEKGTAKRLIEDNFWTKIILHDKPLKDNFYAVIVNNSPNR